MDINNLITSVNDVIWGDCLIYVLIACGLWFTWRTRFMQFRMIGEMFRLLTDAAVDTAGSKKQEEDKANKHISSFQAFIVSVATRVGTGNLAGVASAIAIGGIQRIAHVCTVLEVGSAGPVFVAVAIFLFAYSTIIGNYYYGEANVRFITKSPMVMTVYRILSGGGFPSWRTR